MRLFVIACCVSALMYTSGCASENPTATKSIDLAREKMIEFGRRAQEGTTPTQMIDGETAAAAIRRYRDRSGPQQSPSVPDSLIDALQGSSQ